MTVRSGLQILIEDHPELLRGRRVGLCCNPTTVLPDLTHAVDALHGRNGIQLDRLFGPEHGVRGAAQDMIAVGRERDPGSGLPVVSLYGSDESSLAPKPEDLAGLDLLVFDIQDIGSRYYTYVYTLAYLLEACHAVGVAVLVCDRPNPITGAVEGNLVDIERYRSFVGRFRLPNRHGLTTGELAGWFCGQMGIPVDADFLTLLRCEGWRRGQWFDQTGLPWVMPSPNMPTLDIALVYPGQCLLEGTQVSEGRGTTRPFELFGAPYVDPPRLKAEMDRLAERWLLDGVGFRACSITPTFQKHAGDNCGGLQLHVTDRKRFQPLATGVALLRALHRLYPGDFAWRTETYEFVSEHPAIDLLSGDTSIRDWVESDAELGDLQAEWRRCEAEFRQQVEPGLLYDGPTIG